MINCIYSEKKGDEIQSTRELLVFRTKVAYRLRGVVYETSFRVYSQMKPSLCSFLHVAIDIFSTE